MLRHTCDNELGPEQLCCLLQHVIVNQACLLIQAVGHRLEAATAAVTTEATKAAFQQASILKEDTAIRSTRFE
jgi:hypothetical protein